MQNLNISEFIEIESIGKGCFGRVKKMQYIRNKHIYAVKFLPKSIINDNNQKNIYREINIMPTLTHKNIVKLYGHFEDNNYYYFIYELVQGSDLENDLGAPKCMHVYEHSSVPVHMHTHTHTQMFSSHYSSFISQFQLGRRIG
jgi:serine/threonine protein kinase